MIAVFSEYELPASPGEDAKTDSTEDSGKDLTPSRGRVFCLPARDRADEIAASMLAQLLEKMGLPAVAFPIAESTPREWLTLLEVGGNDIVCISALPPYAFAPARTLCKQIRERFPQLGIIACIWGFSGDANKAKARFDRPQPNCLSTSLAEAIEQIKQLAQSPAAAG